MTIREHSSTSLGHHSTYLLFNHLNDLHKRGSSCGIKPSSVHVSFHPLNSTSLQVIRRSTSDQNLTKTERTLSHVSAAIQKIILESGAGVIAATLYPQDLKRTESMEKAHQIRKLGEQSYEKWCLAMSHQAACPRGGARH